MAGNAAISINQNLTPGETGIRYWPSNYKSTGSINIILSFIVYQRRGDNYLDYLLNDVLFNFIVADIRVMLGSNNYTIYPPGCAIMILYGYL